MDPPEAAKFIGVSAMAIVKERNIWETNGAPLGFLASVVLWQTFVDSKKKLIVRNIVVYRCMYTYIYIYVHIYIYMYIYIYIYIWGAPPWYLPFLYFYWYLRCFFAYFGIYFLNVFSNPFGHSFEGEYHIYI